MQVLKVLGSNPAAVYWLLGLCATGVLWPACNWEQHGAVIAASPLRHQACDKTQVILINIKKKCYFELQYHGATTGKKESNSILFGVSHSTAMIISIDHKLDP